MSLARPILSLSFWNTLCVIALCVVTELFATVLWVFPKMERGIIRLAEKYDAYLPEITIQGGQASIKEKQPYYIENLMRNGLVLVIDTTVSSYDDAKKYLKNASRGVVLTRSSILNKEGDEIKMFSLAQLPDMVINSDNITKAIESIRPIFKTWGLLFLAVFFMVSKLLQALTLAAIPFFAVRLYRQSMTFGEAFRITAISMTVPVGINLFLSFWELSIVNLVLAYYVTFIATIVVVTRDYVIELGDAI